MRIRECGGRPTCKPWLRRTTRGLRGTQVQSGLSPSLPEIPVLGDPSGDPRPGPRELARSHGSPVRFPLKRKSPVTSPVRPWNTCTTRGAQGTGNGRGLPPTCPEIPFLGDPSGDPRPRLRELARSHGSPVRPGERDQKLFSRKRHGQSPRNLNCGQPRACSCLL